MKRVQTWLFVGLAVAAAAGLLLGVVSPGDLAALVELVLAASRR